METTNANIHHAMNSEPSVDRLSFMLSVPDAARADVTMTPERTYYRFMTEDSLEDGELDGLHEKFGEFISETLGSFRAGVGVSAPIDPVRLNMFVNNRKVEPEVLNNTTLRMFIRALMKGHDEFAFFGGFM